MWWHTRRNQISSLARNGRVHLNRPVWRQFSRPLAAEVCASAVVMLDTPCSEVVWKVLATHCTRQFPPLLPLPASPCAITFQMESTSQSQWSRGLKVWVCVGLLVGVAGSKPKGCMNICLLSVICSKVDVSSMGWSFIQRSSTECGVSEWGREVSVARKSWPLGWGGAVLLGYGNQKLTFWRLTTHIWIVPQL